MQELHRCHLWWRPVPIRSSHRGARHPSCLSATHPAGELEVAGDSPAPAGGRPGDELLSNGIASGPTISPVALFASLNSARPAVQPMGIFQA